MSSFRFIHTADIHLDSPLRGLSGHEGEVAEKIRTAPRQAFDNLVSKAIEESVSFFLIAGDLYDGDWRSYQTGLFFVRQMGRLAKAGIPAIVLHGNHDAESQITKSLILPENVRVFSARRPESFELPHLDVVLHGQSYRQRDITDNLMTGYPNPVPGKFNIGVLHTGLGGMGGHLNYAPCTIEELVNKGYEYWALGHVHQGVVLHERPHIVFPGNLQGRHINESGQKSACLVSVVDGEIQEVAPLSTDVVRWARISIPVETCSQLIDVTDSLRLAFERTIATEADGRLLACRIELLGKSSLHEKLMGSSEQIIADARALAQGFGDDAIWIEKVVFSTTPMTVPGSNLADEDSYGDLHRILNEAKDDIALVDKIRAEVGELIQKLPHELRAGADDPLLKLAIDGDYAGLVAQMPAYVAARISVDGE